VRIVVITAESCADFNHLFFFFENVLARLELFEIPRTSGINAQLCLGVFQSAGREMCLQRCLKLPEKSTLGGKLPFSIISKNHLISK